MSAATLPRVEGLETDRSIFDLTRLPQATHDWLKAKGFNYVWVPVSPVSQLRYRHYGYRPLFLKDIDDDLARSEMQSCAVESGVSSGECRMSDCVLMVRSEGTRKFWKEEEEHRARSQMGRTSLAEVAEEANRKAARVGNKPAIQFQETSNDASVHVHGSSSQLREDPQLRKALAETLANME